MDLASDTIGLRALHALRRLHVPAYVATRYLLEATVPSSSTSWARLTFPRKYIDKATPSFRTSKQYKGTSNDGHAQYRDFWVPSPSTALTEAIVLAHLASDRAFAKHPSVYSYHWPSDSTPHFNYEPYRYGYDRRNERIARVATVHPGRSLLVLDIARFYSSIDHARIRHLFSQRISGSSIPQEIQSCAQALLRHCSGLLSGDRGLATGPQISHALADVSLQQVDETLYARFGAGYFRYVDDLVVVTEPSEVDAHTSSIRDLLAAEGLELNEQKSDVVPCQEWMQHGPHTSAGVAPDSFEALVFQIKVALGMRPHMLDRIDRQLREEQFTLPLQRLAVASHQHGFMRQVALLSRLRWPAAVQAVLTTDRDIVEAAHRARSSLRSSLAYHLSESSPSTATRRKWFVQKLRYLANRAIYLLPPSEYPALAAEISRIKDLRENVVLLRLLSGERSNEILELPGSTVSAAASVLRHNNERLNWTEPRNIQPDVWVESIETLLLFGAIAPPSSTAVGATDAHQERLDFALAIPVHERARPDFSYSDEVCSLRIGKSFQDAQKVLDTRFSDREQSVFDALDIGGAYAS